MKFKDVPIGRRFSGYYGGVWVKATEKTATLVPLKAEFLPDEEVELIETPEAQDEV